MLFAYKCTHGPRKAGERRTCCWVFQQVIYLYVIFLLLLSIWKHLCEKQAGVLESLRFEGSVWQWVYEREHEEKHIFSMASYYTKYNVFHGCVSLKGTAIVS